MDWRTLLVDLAKSLAWPATVLVLMATFRKPLVDLLRNLSGLRYKDLELRFRRGLRESEALADRARLPGLGPEIPPRPSHAYSGPSELKFPDEIRLLAYRSPRSAVIEAWLLLEDAAKDRLRAESGEVPSVPGRLLRSIEERGLLGDDALKLFHKLRELRNEVVHDSKLWLSPEYADEFVLIAERLYAALKSGPQGKRRAGDSSEG